MSHDSNRGDKGASQHTPRATSGRREPLPTATSRGEVRILILEDREADAELEVRELRRRGIQFTSKHVAGKEEFLAELRGWAPHLVLADHSLPGYDGMAALAATRKERPEALFIFVSGVLGEEAAIEALHHGATDYVLKGGLNRLGPAVQRALHEIEERARRREAEQALIASERNYREIFNATSDAIFVHDALTGEILDVNRSASDLCGYTREELLNLQGAILPPTGPFSFQEALRRIELAVAEGPQLFSWRSPTKGGQLLWTEVALRRANLGGQDRVLAVVRDITQRKQAEEALRTSEQRWRFLFEYAPDGYFLNDMEGTFVDGNRAAEELIGYRREELIGRSFLQLNLLVGDGLARAAEHLARNRRGEAGGPEEFIIRRKDSTELPVEIRTFPVELQGKRLVLGIARDLTFRKQAAKVLRELNLLLRAIRNINKLIVQERDPKRLLNRACEILVQTRGYSLVWIGRQAPDSKRVMPLARAGKHTDYLDEVIITADESPAAQGPVGWAIRSSQTCVIQDTAADPRFEPWQKPAWKRGFASVAAVPMIHAGQVLGVVSFYSDKKGTFHEEEATLLSELAGDLAFALQSIEHERERRRAELRVTAFAYLGQRLSVARTARQAAEIIVSVADQLLGLDACTFDLYSPETGRLEFVLNQDTVGSQRVDCPSVYNELPPSPRIRRVIESGGQLILKDQPQVMLPDATAFGDTSRPSASILIVPVRDGPKVIGILSIHSYTPKAYDQQSLDTLQALADHCGGALQRIRAQEALGESESNYRSLVEGSPDAILIHRDARLVYANPAGLKLVRAERPQQVLGRSVFDLVPLEYQEAVRQRIRHVSEGGAVPPLDQKILRLDGTGVEAEVTSITCIYRGEPAVQTIMRDIADRKLLEQQLRQAQKMEAVGQLAGGVAHDFNNLLAVIQGNADLLLMEPSQLTSEVSAGLKQIIAASERAANLTRQLLIFSRKGMMQSRPLLLNEVISELTKMLKRIIGEHISLQCRYAAQLPHVQADLGMIEQALVNLTVNARDAMPRGGQLVIAAQAVRLDEAQARKFPEGRAGEFACLSVSDNGSGIAPEHLPHIFEPFFTTKEPGKGTGLGLATVHGIVKQHQGWIEVASQPGAGATFRIFLPAIATPAPSAGALQADPVPPRGTETILLVEDDYAVRLTTRRVLESHGYKVIEANSGPDALELWSARAHEIALLLSDIIMPEGVSGRELSEQLRAQKPSLKVLLISGYSADVIGSDTEFFRRAGSYFLHKPCASRVLLNAVRRCLDE